MNSSFGFDTINLKWIILYRGITNKIVFLSMNMFFSEQNGVDPDEMSHYQGLHCNLYTKGEIHTLCYKGNSKHWKRDIQRVMCSNCPRNQKVFGNHAFKL